MGDFFAKKKKKAPKGSNLNNEASTDKPEEKKKGKKDKEEEGWEDEQIVAPTMMVQVAGRLVEEEKEEEKAVAAWGTGKKAKGPPVDDRRINEKRFPTLQKAVGLSTNINIDDGSNATINIKASKNVFSALEDDDGDEDAPKKRPNHIKPAMVTKVKGERACVALQREVEKYVPKKEEKKKAPKKKKDKGSDSDSDSDSEEDSEEEDEDEEDLEAAAAARAKAKQDEKKRVAKEAEAKAKAAAPKQVEVEDADDCKIVPDEKAARAKYIGREKPHEAKPLPKSEIEDERKNRGDGGISKKKKKFMELEEQDGKRPLAVAEWDD